MDRRVRAPIPSDEGPVDTCIAMRTILVKDGTAYLQAGVGIVYNSGETEEPYFVDLHVK